MKCHSLLRRPWSLLLAGLSLAFLIAPAAGQTTATENKPGLSVSKVELEYEVEHDGVAAMRALLDRSDAAYTPADLNAVLLLAASKQSPEIVRMLLDHGAAVNAVDEQQRTPLMIAASRGNKTILKLLLSKGAHTSAKDASGNTVMAYAASRYEGMRLLIEAGARAGRADLNKALIWAVREENRVGVAYLLEQGADPHTRDNFLKCRTGMTAEQVRNYRGPRVLDVARQHLAEARDEHNPQNIARCQRILQLLQHKRHAGD